MADGNESSSDEESYHLLNDIAPPSLPEIDGIDQQFRTHRPSIKFSGLVEILIFKRTNEYQYDELGLKQIRLLRLTKGKRNDDIHCVLTPIKLSRRSMPDLPYQALSYVWGTDNPTKHIQILDAKGPVKRTERSTFAPTRWGDFAYKALVHRRAELVRGKMPSAKKFYVRANLYAALRQLRLEDRDSLFWIDAICINQDNDKEKTQQLSRMHDIYNKACNVCIWLGEADEEGKSQRAMEFIHSAINLKNLDALVSLSDFETLSLIEKASRWDSLAELMSFSWFSRRWVVQEVALARSASLHCGKETTNWVNFADAVANFVTKLDAVRALYKKADPETYNPGDLSFVEGLGAKVMVSTITNLFRKSDDGEILDRLLPLETLVSTLLTFDASNPRDIIYALHSVANDSPTAEVSPRHAGLQDDRASLEPDYSKDPVEVYTDFVRHCIDSGSLDIICRHWASPVRKETKKLSTKVQDVQDLVRLPSWIGLVKDSPFGVSDRLTGRQNGESLVGLPNERRYNASDGEKPRHRFETKGGRYDPPQRRGQSTVPYGPANTFDVTLCCKGLTLRHITKVSARIVNATITRECLEMLGWIQGELNENPKKVPDRLWRTLVADRGPDGTNTPSWYHRACLHCLATSSTGDISTGELIQNEESPQLMVEYLKRVQCVVWNRTVIKAEAHSQSEVHQEDGAPHEAVKSSEHTSRKRRRFNTGLLLDQSASSRRRLDRGGRTTSTSHSRARGPECLFGLAPQTAMVGDLVCILFGCSVPVILREITDKWRKPRDRRVYHELIGEAYIHGKMDGEALSTYATMEELNEAVVEFLLR